MPTKPPVEEEANCTEPKSDNDKDNRCLFRPDQSTLGNNQGHAYQGRHQAWSRIIQAVYPKQKLPPLRTDWVTWGWHCSGHLSAVANHLSCHLSCMKCIVCNNPEIYLIDWLIEPSQSRFQPSQLLSQLPTIAVAISVANHLRAFTNHARSRSRLLTLN